ncbi:MAG: CRTAC1 family protein [Planctomycetaceae bacterium]
MTEKQKARPWHWVLVGLIVVGVTAVVVLRGKPIGNEIAPPKVDVARMLELKNDAIALMENWRFDLSTEKLSELETLLPNEPLVRRNRAIAAVLAVSPEGIDKTREREAYERGYARAVEAVDKLLASEPELPIAHLLAAKLAAHGGDDRVIVGHLEKAARLSNGAAAFEAEVYLASQMGQDPELAARGVAALQRAALANPDNLWVFSELAVAHVVSQSDESKLTLTRLRELSQPFAEFIQQRYRVNIGDSLDKSVAAIEAKDWGTATRNVRIVSNLLRPEIAMKLDLKNVLKHPLEYVLSDFSSEWQKQHGDATKQSGAVATAPIEVTFAEAAAADQLPPLAGIRDLKIADFDLDGRWDVIVLLNGQVIVFGQSNDPKSRWVTLCEAVVPSGLTKLIAADLDRDTEETPDDHRFIGQLSGKALATGHSPEVIGAAAMAEDADIDLLVYGDDGVLFLRNVYDAATKTRSLAALSQEPAFEAMRGVLAIAPADIDHDGDLDLIVSSNSGMSIWQNNDSREHTKFADISARSALPPNDLKPTVLLPVDWNFDVQMDVLVTGPDVAKPGWLENVSHGRLRWREWLEPELPIANVVSLHLMAVKAQPLKWDLLGPRAANLRGLRLWDFNNDGQRDQLAWNRGGLKRIGYVPNLGDVEHPLTDIKLGEVTIGEIADFDADGDEDVLVVTDQRAVWIRNDGGNKNGWLDLSIRADKDRKPQRDAERSNIHGVGSWLELRGAGLPELPGRKQHVRIVDGQSTHFGLGSAKQVDAARIVWTNGVPQNILRPRSGEAIAAQQFLKGSCPYLYLWDGERWVFYTDCLWAAPIGLQLAEGVMAPAREWEFLKIDGDRLRESNGEYRVMLTEELWEAAYFDQVRLLAVDHPADVEFFSNEKVGPPSIAEFKLHPVRKRHSPTTAHDHRGRDVLSRLARRDEKYLRAFDKIIQQGLTEEHFIELELGDLSDAKNVTLFLTGWIFPTDTSINVSLSQNPDREGPKPPSIWVPVEEEGERGRGGEGEITWREAIPYIGFPGGKTKTIAVDLSSLLADSRKPKADRRYPFSFRVRIVTSMELYWDEVFFTVDELPLEQTTTQLPLIGADLQFRGFSARLPHAEFGPERYDASQITTETQWPPMGGKFTRFGDVTELLSDSDDRLAILGAGDAVTIRFRADHAPRLPPGWKRDFIIHNVGYDKDADLNTVYGQYVEPLPFRAMRGYPDPTGAEFPDLPIHRADRQRFQTREQSRKAFWLGR